MNPAVLEIVSMKPDNSVIDALLASDKALVMQEWLDEVGSPSSASFGTHSRRTASPEAAELLSAFHDGIRADGDCARLDDPNWQHLREVLTGVSKTRAAQGASAGDTSHFILSLKRPLFARLQSHLAGNNKELLETIWAVSSLVDQMAQFTVSAYQRSREEVITRQQQELLELSTPVVRLWDGVLAAPMIGTLDSGRTQMVMESLLHRIVETGSQLAIIDITGVPTVDTLVAQHLLKTVAAIRLMGADCIISGVRPQIAQTIVQLGIDLHGITTKASLADALRVALKTMGYTVTRNA